MKNICGLLVGVALVLSALIFNATVEAVQKEKKPWTERSQKDAEKMLTNSPWAQIQKDTDPSEMFFRPALQTRRHDAGRQTRILIRVITEILYTTRDVFVR